MNNIFSIRKRLGLSQADFGAAIGVSQGNVSHYERGRQEVPPHVARQIIEAAAKAGLTVTFDDIYGELRGEAGAPDDAGEGGEFGAADRRAGGERRDPACSGRRHENNAADDDCPDGEHCAPRGAAGRHEEAA